jgi:hypothetical protein
MIISLPPTLPFPSFKWRWASVAPTEGLNDPKVYLGALRAFLKFEGQSPNTSGLLKELAIVQLQTGTKIDLVRTADRNLIRNSGQYWKAFGLLESSNPKILLSQFGKDVASGKVTMAEFAATVIATMELPNKSVQKDVSLWLQNKICFKPLEIILEILFKLHSFNFVERYLTKFELVHIVMPISAISKNVDDFVDTILAHRKGVLSLSNWPKCAKEANDHRMADEFLLFLQYYGYCSCLRTNDHWNDKYTLEVIEASALQSIFQTKLPIDINQAAKVIASTGVADFIERKRTLREVLNRPSQSKFRREVLNSSGCQCVVTGTQLDSVLEAAHIIPVKDNGNDSTGNGFCMRSDIHTLFDNGHLRIDPVGGIHLSNTAKNDVIYQQLPMQIIIPKYVAPKYLAWRWDYA